jgi:hypothetical protein
VKRKTGCSSFNWFLFVLIFVGLVSGPIISLGK